jgi:hypothetical protein
MLNAPLYLLLLAHEVDHVRQAIVMRRLARGSQSLTLHENSP